MPDHEIVSLPRSVLTSPLCAAFDTALAPREFRREIWRGSLADQPAGPQNGGGRSHGDGCRALARRLCSAPDSHTDSDIHSSGTGSAWRLTLTTWLLGIPLASAAWCGLRHVLSSGTAQPNLFDDLMGAALALILLLIP